MFIDSDGAIVATDSVNWSARPFPYQLRQHPGASNALGRLRFDLLYRRDERLIRAPDAPDAALVAGLDQIATTCPAYAARPT